MLLLFFCFATTSEAEDRSSHKFSRVIDWKKISLSCTAQLHLDSSSKYFIMVTCFCKLISGNLFSSVSKIFMIQLIVFLKSNAFKLIVEKLKLLFYLIFQKICFNFKSRFKYYNFWTVHQNLKYYESKNDWNVQLLIFAPSICGAFLACKNQNLFRTLIHSLFVYK